MKYLALLFCVLLGTTSALPRPEPHIQVFDVLALLEKVVEHEGQALLEEAVKLIHVIQGAAYQVKSSVPGFYEKFHQEVDEVLAELKVIYDEIEELLGRKDVAYGFDLLGGLTELTGGTQLGTVLKLLSLADKIHRVVEDAKNFVPHLEKTLDEVQRKVATHFSQLSNQLLREISLQKFIAQSVTGKIENLLEEVENEAHALLLDLLHKIEQALDVLETGLPEVYDHFKHSVEEIRKLSRDILKEVEKALHVGGYSLLDIAGDFTGGTSLGTMIKVMSLIDKFNTVMQDVRQFGPHAEVLLEHSVRRVADSAQEFLSHAANMMLE